MRGRAAPTIDLTSADNARNVTILSLLCGALALSILAGRQLAGDGILFVEESLLNPGWFPQPTPRRLFAVLWTTGAVRLLGLIDPTQIEFGSILFGIFGYLQISLEFGGGDKISPALPVPQCDRHLLKFHCQ
jgi:hypothetical protein